MARPPAPALDVIAARNSSASISTATPDTNTTTATDTTTPTALTSSAAVMNSEDRDSRSSSSTNSPVLVENEESDFFGVANDSQSSLGVVPSLQEMQVVDTECMPIISALPSEILISIFSRLNDPQELLNCMLTCKRWARNVVEILWHRPSCQTWEKHHAICNTLGRDNPLFAYNEFIKRLNLSSLENVNDGSVIPLAVCNRVERLTLTQCVGLTDVGLKPLVTNNPHLLALDISLDRNITEASILAIAGNCRKLQGLNVSGCNQISNESLVTLAENCRYIKRLKLNDLTSLNDAAVLAFAEHCPNILEIDLHECGAIGNEPVTALLSKQQSLRELRLASCELIDDGAFLALPPYRTYENLRILDLTSCSHLTDRAVAKIIDVAPRLRNLVLAKCSAITDTAVHNIARLGKNLHYVHLGHCRNITDEAVKRLVRSCNRIRYIDLGCCSHLTDESVKLLAGLPKLKRIGLVKCAAITDESMYALARANDNRAYRTGPHMSSDVRLPSLERVHLSYCTNLTLPSIIKLLNCCPKLTHLSLTGVPAFLRDDLDNFCREAPSDFTEHQRAVFCVFSGTGVTKLRDYLNTKEEFAEHRQGRSQRRRGGTAPGALPAAPGFIQDDGDDDGEGLEDEDLGDDNDPNELTNLAHNPVPPPPPHHSPTELPHSHPGTTPNSAPTGGHPSFAIPTGMQPSMAQSLPNNPGPSTAGASVQSAASHAGPSTASMQGTIAEEVDEDA
ncbi:hypothetical protein F5Y16DRAFT_133070 [Xylariaceae sp. FL0255]|nr:hypothetical protein F5Y16DRAFT_133070 [Xylariaceae sp. FL0255]